MSDELESVCHHGVSPASSCQNELCILRAALAARNERVRVLEERLELWATDNEGNRVYLPSESTDGIACRDATIRLQDENVAKLQGRVRELEAGLRLLVELSDEVMRTEWGSSPAAEQDLRKRCGQAYASARALLDPHATKEPT